MSNQKYCILNFTPVELIHILASGDFDGSKPEQTGLTFDLVEPVVSGGRAAWVGLTKGGFFNFDKRPLVIEALFAEGCTASWKITDKDGNEIRSVPATPFKLSPYEKLKATSTGGSTNAKVGCVARIEE